MTLTPIIRANPTISAETATAFRTGARSSSAAARRGRQPACRGRIRRRQGAIDPMTTGLSHAKPSTTKNTATYPKSGAPCTGSCTAANPARRKEAAASVRTVATRTVPTNSYPPGARAWVGSTVTASLIGPSEPTTATTSPISSPCTKTSDDTHVRRGGTSDW